MPTDGRRPTSKGRANSPSYGCKVPTTAQATGARSVRWLGIWPLVTYARWMCSINEASTTWVICCQQPSRRCQPIGSTDCANTRTSFNSAAFCRTLAVANSRRWSATISSMLRRTPRDLRLGILSVLLERYAKRIPQRNLFEDNIQDVQPNRPLTVDAGVADGARVHLLHKYERPYFFGIDVLCDASSENAEQFLQLAAELVARLETRLVRGKPATLTTTDQHKLLRMRATRILDPVELPRISPCTTAR